MQKHRVGDGKMAAAFSLIYADPPWSFRAWSSKGEGRSASRHYPIMALEEICALPVAAIAAKDAVLALWAINPMLPEALQVMDYWGFKFKTVLFVWAKGRIGLGYYTRAGAELCLLGTRGRGLPRMTRAERQVVYAKPSDHSRKPEEFARSLERLFGDVPRIELFARQLRPGWTLWGNEVPDTKTEELFEPASSNVLPFLPGAQKKD